jgi:lysophospholipase L1-like esterase
VRPRPPRSLKRSLLAAGCGTLGALIGAEIGLALFHPVPFRRRPEVVGDFALRLHQASSVPGLEYELVPSAAVEMPEDGVRVHTNALGLRGPEIERAKAPGVVRVAAIGDSFTFGHGVADEETYPFQLERALNRDAPPGTRFEVLNFGVSGYGILDELAVLREKALALDPDVVLLGYLLNDPDAHPEVDLHLEYHRPLWWERFELARLLVRWRIRRAEAAAGSYWQRLHDPEGASWPNVVRGFAEMRVLTEERGIPLVVVPFPVLFGRDRWQEDGPIEDVLDQVAREAESAGLRVARLDRAVKELVPSRRSIKLTKHDHANAEGNRVFAEWLRGVVLEALGRGASVPGGGG